MKQVHAPQTETRQEQKELTAKQKVQIQDTEDKTQKEVQSHLFFIQICSHAELKHSKQIAS